METPNQSICGSPAQFLALNSAWPWLRYAAIVACIYQLNYTLTKKHDVGKPINHMMIFNIHMVQMWSSPKLRLTWVVTIILSTLNGTPSAPSPLPRPLPVWNKREEPPAQPKHKLGFAHVAPTNLWVKINHSHIKQFFVEEKTCHVIPKPLGISPMIFYHLDPFGAFFFWEETLFH